MKMHIPKPGERVAFASTFIPCVNRLLDVGCGDGVIAHFVKDRVEKIYGIDRFAKDLVTAKKMGLITQVVDLDIKVFPYKKNYFDAVTCLDVIEHVKDPKFLLKNIHSVLKKKGLLVISTPNIRFSDHIFTLIFKGIFPKTSLDPQEYDGGHVHFFTFKDMINLLENAGFTVMKKEGIINKSKRGWKGRLLEDVIGKAIMREFRSPGILLVAEKK